DYYCYSGDDNNWVF
nr:immunoglobulin light chain junction region [Macaca mulatta]